MRIAVAMSGGIDSSITAILLKELGHDIIGVTAKLINISKKPDIYTNEFVKKIEKSIHDAKKIAKQYEFPHHIIELETDFDKQIIDPFCKQYLQGKTPSPCIRCNAIIKFDKLVHYIKLIGYDKIATGHYAQIDNLKKRYFIKAAHDLKKDQSYFLFMLSQQVLQDIILPLGKYKKEDIRAIARKHQLKIADKPDSQEICFIPDDNYKQFIQKYTGNIPKSGDIVNSSGKIIGTHKGIYYYTIGQRRGLGIAAEKPLYVIDINAKKNIIIAGFKEELYKKGLIANELYFMKNEDLNIKKAYVKTRSTQSPVKCQIEQLNNKIKITFEQSLEGISPGQAAVIYNESKEILGGGWIESSF